MPTTKFTQIPFSNPDLNRPGAGVEQWHDQNYVNIPVQGTNTQRLDKYFRFSWSHFEKTRDQYDWTKFNREINDAIDKRQKFGFGIMTHYPDAQGDHRLNYDGGYAVYPQYLHTMMQAEPVKDWRASNGAWVPNWNSPSYHDRLLKLHQALDNHIKSTSYKGVRYQDVINYVDIRGYGAFGEWHSYTIADQMSQYPAGTRATVASLKKIVDAHRDGFPDFPLVSMISGFDANWLNNTMNPPEIAHYLLTQKNNWGLFGWRRDNWGATDNYIRDYLDRNNRSFGGLTFKDAIMDRWKFAPVNGEPCCSTDYAQIESQIRMYHAVSFGNGNFSVNNTNRTNIRAASKAAGYRYHVSEATFSVTPERVLIISMDWNNTGISPTYENWNILFQLRRGTTVVWEGKSKLNLKLFLPTTVAQRFTDTISLEIPAGTYSLHFSVVDPNGFRSPMPLFMNGVQSDGSFLMGDVTISSSGSTTTSTSTTSSTTIAPTTTTTTTTSTSTTTTTTQKPMKKIDRVVVYYDDGTSFIIG